MSELKEIGGFIVSGNPLVYADSATMTGQGTVSEPFGVKSTDLYVQEPLYTGVSGNSAYIGWNNETVLWSGSYTPVNNGYIDLSGYLSDYEKVKFSIFGYQDFMPQNYEYTFYSGGDKTIPIIAFGIPTDGGVRINSCKATCNNEYNRLTFTVCKQENLIGTSVSTAAFNSVISKIVGINHKV